MSAVTGISGIQLSAASAAYAPTNSVDVSAIASAYQVVSSTSTQLYAGTAYLTEVNDAPVSASRAGNAANAGMANSAYYDGTGRLISSLPDSAAVSSIASSYAESAASGKLDESASSNFYTTANESGFLTGIPNSLKVANISASGHVRATGTGGLRGHFDYAGMYFRNGDTRPYNIGMDNTGSNFYIATARNGFERIYASSIQSWNGKADSSALSSYVPYSSLEYNTASAISGINGSALAAGSTYSAGEGIDITDDVISVEAPVDIVAGPGIVIDNPDGNTLRVSTDEDYETVLWNGTAAIPNFPITLSEVPANFERVRISFKSWTDNPTFNEFPGSANIYNLNSNWSDGNGVSFYFNERLTLSGTTLSFISGKFCAFGDSVVNNQTGNFTVYKIVGIHRIANN